jgi:hypothetical protein
LRYDAKRILGTNISDPFFFDMFADGIGGFYNYSKNFGQGSNSSPLPPNAVILSYKLPFQNYSHTYFSSKSLLD